MTIAPPHPKQIWDAALGELQLQLPPPSYKTWLEGTRGVASENGEFVIGTDNAFVSEMLDQRMRHLIERALESVSGEHMSARFQVLPAGARDGNGDGGANDGGGDAGDAGGGNGGAAHPTAAAAPASDARRAAHPAAALNPKYIFERFIVGKSNELAHAAALAVADKPGAAYNPLVLYSDVGLGKTHLLHAIGARAQARGMALIYATTEEFTNEYIRAIREGRTEEFRLRYRSADMLLLDDIQFLIGKEQTQEGFFHTFNALHMSDRQIVITSDRPVTALKALEERISSRLNWGLVADIQAPDLETRLAILRAKADETKVNAPQDALEALAARVFRNIRELEGSLNRVAAYAQLTGRPLDADLARQVVSDAQRDDADRRPSGDEVLDAVAQRCGVDRDALRGTKRDKKTALARQIAMYIMREDAQMSITAIADALDKKHPTVLHGYKTVANQQNVDEKLRRDILRVREALAAK